MNTVWTINSYTYTLREVELNRAIAERLSAKCPFFETKSEAAEFLLNRIASLINKTRKQLEVAEKRYQKCLALYGEAK